MNIVFNIKNFLENKLKLHNISRKTFANESSIIYKTVCSILNCQRCNTELVTIIKIANYFNCSIDEVLGRVNCIQNDKFYDLNTVLNNYNKNLQQFLYTKIQTYKLNPYQLSKTLGFNDTVIIQFIRDKSYQRKLTTPVVISVANYFHVSIDEMIGRIKT